MEGRMEHEERLYKEPRKTGNKIQDTGHRIQNTGNRIHLQGKQITQIGRCAG